MDDKIIALTGILQETCKYIDKYPIKPIDKEDEIVYGCLFLRIIETNNSIIKLCLTSSFIDAYALTRISYEALYKFAYLVYYPQKVDYFLKDADIDRWGEYLYFKERSIIRFNETEIAYLKKAFIKAATVFIKNSKHKDIDIDLDDINTSEKFNNLFKKKLLEKDWITSYKALEELDNNEDFQTEIGGWLTLENRKEAFERPSGAVHSGYIRLFDYFFEHYKDGSGAFNTNKVNQIELKMILKSINQSFYVVSKLANKVKITTIDIDELQERCININNKINKKLKDEWQ